MCHPVVKFMILNENCLATEFTIPYAEKNSQTTYIVSCIGPCRQITAFLEVASGDADLYAREDRAPVIEVRQIGNLFYIFT